MQTSHQQVILCILELLIQSFSSSIRFTGVFYALNPFSFVDLFPSTCWSAKQPNNSKNRMQVNRILLSWILKHSWKMYRNVAVRNIKSIEWNCDRERDRKAHTQRKECKDNPKYIGLRKVCMWYNRVKNEEWREKKRKRITLTHSEQWHQ